MRKVRGVKAVAEYLNEIQCPLSESSIYRLVKTGGIPFKRITPQVLIFDLDKIDKWLGSEDEMKIGTEVENR